MLVNEQERANVLEDARMQTGSCVLTYNTQHVLATLRQRRVGEDCYRKLSLQFIPQLWGAV